jgi:hypothetical protein
MARAARPQVKVSSNVALVPLSSNVTVSAVPKRKVHVSWQRALRSAEKEWGLNSAQVEVIIRAEVSVGSLHVIGWVVVADLVTHNPAPGSNATYDKMVIVVDGKTGKGRFSYPADPEPSWVPSIRVGDVQVFEQSGATWVAAKSVRLGDRIRLVASYEVEERAGIFFPSCVRGTLELIGDGKVPVTIPVQCPDPQPADFTPQVYADASVTPDLGPGSVTARFDLTYDEGQYGVARGRASTSFQVTP